MSALQFLNNKSWSVARLHNKEKVWIAEKKEAEEKKKVEELKKRLAEERQVEELQRLEVQSGRLDPEAVKRKEKLDWMYEFSKIKENEEGAKTKEEYLTGQREAKVEEAKPEESSVGSHLPGSIRVRDVEAKLREDPLMAIKMEEQNAIRNIRSNPVRMEEIRQKVQSGREAEKAERKKLKKEKKRGKKEKEKKEKREKRKRSEKAERDGSSDEAERRKSRASQRAERREDEDDHRRVRERSVRTREDESPPSRPNQSRRSESPAGQDRGRTRGYRDHERDERGRDHREHGRDTGRRDHRDHEKDAGRRADEYRAGPHSSRRRGDDDDGRRPQRREDDAPTSRRRDGYGLSASRENGHQSSEKRDTISAFKQFSKGIEKRNEKYERQERERASSPATRAHRLAEMQAAASEHAEGRKRRYDRHREQEEREEEQLKKRALANDGEGLHDSFLGRVSKDAYSGMRVEASVSRSRGRIQRGESASFKR